MEQFSPVSQVLHSEKGPSDSRETNLEASPVSKHWQSLVDYLLQALNKLYIELLE